MLSIKPLFAGEPGLKKRLGSIFLFFFIGILAYSQTGEENRGGKLIDENAAFNKYEIPFENQWALLIGIDEYKYIKKLNNAVFDVTTIRDILVSKYGYPISNIKKLELELYNNNATWEKINEKLRIVTNKMTEKDSLLIYFAGHGHLDRDYGRGYWLPVDCGEGIPKLKKGSIDESTLNKIPNKIHSADIQDIMAKCKAKHIFVIADSCYSDTFFNLDRGETRDLTAYFYKKSRNVLASGRGIVSDGKKGTHSPFASALINFLENSSEKEIFSSKLIADVKKMVAITSGQIPVGGPVKGDEGGEFIFFRKEFFLLDQMKNDLNSLYDTIERSSLSLSDKLKQCDDFLEKYKGESYQGYSKKFREFNELLSKVEGYKRDLEKQKELLNVDLNKDLKEGDRLFREGKYSDAKNCYEKILENRPNDPLATEKIKKCQNMLYDKNAALTLWSEKKYDESYEYLERLIQISPADTEIAGKLKNYRALKSRQYAEEGALFSEKENFKKAIESYTKALEWLPDDPGIKEKIQQARDKYDRKLLTANIERLLVDADSLFKEGKHKDSLAVYQKLFQFNGYQPPAAVTEKIAACEKEVAYTDLKSNINLEGYLDFIDRYPGSSHCSELKQLLISKDKNLPLEKYWKTIKKNNRGYYENKFDNNHLMIYIPSRNFWIDKYEVSNAQFRHFLKVAYNENSPSKPNDFLIEKDEYPALVRYRKALEYCQSYKFRLPTDEEWKFVWGENRYPWGNAQSDDSGIYRANYNDEDEKDGFVGTAPVSSFQEFSSPFGVVNLAGNVWEWVSGNALKGGGFFSGKEDLDKNILIEDKDDSEEGFRCIREESK